MSFSPPPHEMKAKMEDEQSKDFNGKTQSDEGDMSEMNMDNMNH